MIRFEVRNDVTENRHFRSHRPLKEIVAARAARKFFEYIIDFSSFYLKILNKLARAAREIF